MILDKFIFHLCIHIAKYLSNDLVIFFLWLKLLMGRKAKSNFFNPIAIVNFFVDIEIWIHFYNKFQYPKGMHVYGCFPQIEFQFKTCQVSLSSRTIDN